MDTEPATAKKPTDAGEIFLRLVVVMAGMLLGAVAALILGLMMDLISLEC